MLEKINPESEFQFYDLTRLWNDIECIVSHDIDLIHLFPEPIKVQMIIDALFPDKTVGADAAPKALYDYRTKHAALFDGQNGYIYDSAEVLRQIAAFVRATRQ